MSGLAGACFDGICVCKMGFTVQLSGKCGKAAAPNCEKQGGTCFQGTESCAPGKLAGYQATITCGDLIAAVCCFDEAKCKSAVIEVPGKGYVPSPFHCCAGDDSGRDAICVNGWQTCHPGDMAQRKGFNCPGA